MRKSIIATLLFFGFFVGTARGQTGVINLSVTSSPLNITVNTSCSYVVIQENSANPANAFTITLPGSATGITYAAGTKFIFSANAGGFVKGQTIGSITVASGTVNFVGIESITTPTVPAKTSGSGGGGGTTLSVDGVVITNPNLQDSNANAYTVSGSDIQLLPQYSEVGPVGIVNGNFVAPNFYPTGGVTPYNPPQGWNLAPTTTSISYDQTTAPANNEFSLKITCTVSASQDCAINNNALISLIPNQTYTLTGYVRGDGTVGAQLALEFERSADPAGDNFCVSSPVTSTTWTFVTITCTAGNQDNGIIIVTQNDDLSSTAGSMWVQDLQVYSNSFPNFTDVSEIAAPANPVSGVERWFANSTSHQLTCLLSTGANCLPNAPGGSNTQFQFNNSGTLGGVSDLTYVTHTITLGASGILTITAGATVNGITNAMLPVVAVGNGGTSFSSYVKGQLLCAAGSTTLNQLTVGSDTQVLTADSTQTCGIKWASPVAGTVNAAAQYSGAYYSASGSATTISGYTPPTVDGFWVPGYNVTAGVAVAPAAYLPGISPRDVTGTTSTDTIVYSDCSNAVFYEGSVAVATALTTPAGLGNSHCVTSLVNRTTGSTTAVTVTSSGGLTINGNATYVIAQGQTVRFTVDTSGNWEADGFEPQIAAGNNISLTRSAYGLTVTSGPADTTTSTNTTTRNANTCDASATTVTMTGVTTAMTFSFTPSVDVSGVTGWGSTGGLVIEAWPTSNTLNYKVCNQTLANITPGGSVTWNVSAR